MFVILLRFAENKAKAGEFMEGHNAWIKQGFDEGAFLVVGSLQPNAGGGIVATAGSLSEMETRVSQDPFVAEGIVKAEIIEISPVKADERLQFLLN